LRTASSKDLPRLSYHASGISCMILNRAECTRKQYGFELNFEGAFLGFRAPPMATASVASPVHRDRRSLGPYTLGLKVMVLSIGKRACSQGFTLKASRLPGREGIPCQQTSHLCERRRKKVYVGSDEESPPPFDVVQSS
jgi:hypothetical protein